MSFFLSSQRQQCANMNETGGTSSSLPDDVATYSGRLATFGLTSDIDTDLSNENSTRPTRQWPETAAVDPSKLARAGFYLNQNLNENAEDDTVECFACHKRLSQWKFNDSALRRHRDASPTCPFLCGMSVEQQHSPAVSESNSLRSPFPQSTSMVAADNNHSSPNNLINHTLSLPVVTNDLSLTSPTLSERIHPDSNEIMVVDTQIDGNELTKRCQTPVAPVTTSTGNADDLFKTAHDAETARQTRITTANNVDILIRHATDDSPDMMNDDDNDVGQRSELASTSDSVEINQFPEFFTYEARLRSFSSNVHQQAWPISHVLPDDLADVGFFYTGEADKVRCAFCGGVQSRWQPGEQPWLEHIKYFPHCPLVRTRLRQLSKQRHGSHARQRSSASFTGSSAASAALQSAHDGDDDYSIATESSSIFAPAAENDANESTPRHLPTPRTQQQQQQQHLQHAAAADDDGLYDSNAGEDVAGINDAAMLQQPNTAGEPRYQQQQPHNSIQYCHRASSPPDSDDDTADEELGILSNSPQRPDLATIDARLATFTTKSATGGAWPQHDVQQQPMELAEAGLYYIGKQDKTKCFFCDGGLGGWQPGDIAWNEHARWYPHCAFVLSVKGRVFVNEMLANHRPTSHSPPPAAAGGPSAHTIVYNRNVSSSTSTLPNSASFSTLPLSMPRDSNENSSPQNAFVLSFNHRLKVPRQFVEQARLMGFTDVRIRRAIEMLANETVAEGEKFTLPALNVLIDYILRDADNIREASVERSLRTGTNYNRHDSKVAAPEVAQDNVVAMIPAEQSGASSSSGSMDKQQQQQQMRKVPSSKNINGGTAAVSTTTCKICMDHEVGVAFLPCSHLVSCAYCAPALKFCPVCRTPIRKIFKTYLS